MTKEEQAQVVLLNSLIDLGGAPTKDDALTYIQDNNFWYMNDNNSPHPPSRPSEYSWRNNISFTRDHLVKKECIDNSIKNIWRITDKGRMFYQRLATDFLNSYPLKESRVTDNFYNHLINIQFNSEIVADELLIKQVYLSSCEVKPIVQLDDNPHPKGSYTIAGNRKHYKRDSKISENALALAEYKCEMDNSHQSFICRNKNHLYMEPHHLIPMFMTDEMNVSLDREQNIFCLCSNCHKRIHYGTKEDVKKMIKKLFIMRSDKIKSILGRDISLQEICKMYKVD